MKLSWRLILLAVLLSGFLSSCGSKPEFQKPDLMASVSKNYLMNKAEAGLTWKTRAEEIIRQSKASGNFQLNEFRIQRAYAKVDTNLQVWANAVTADSKVGKPVLETKQLQDQVEVSLKELGEVAGVEGTKGWKRDLVAALLKTLFPAAAPVVTQLNTAWDAAEAERLRTSFIKAHQLLPASKLVPPAPAPPS
ncbi:hypothetical protein N9B47_02060 [bacterium]|nr:hypothetical protein [bacterium]MDB4357963.1 hypothetical protein [bacterium]MDB4466091.1 hypothetical protein [bacterium]